MSKVYDNLDTVVQQLLDANYQMVNIVFPENTDMGAMARKWSDIAYSTKYGTDLAFITGVAIMYKAVSDAIFAGNPSTLKAACETPDSFNNFLINIVVGIVYAAKQEESRKNETTKSE